jgi:hypothetical protein
MGDVHQLRNRREMFIDERGHGLQMSWDPNHAVIIVSIWHDDTCVGTTRLPVADAARAGGFLLAVLNDWLGQVQEPRPAAGADPAPD